MFKKRTIVAALVVTLVCSSVQIALADGGTIKGSCKWEGKAPSRKPIQVSADPQWSTTQA